MHEKKTKGDLGVAFAIGAITEQGWNVCIPLTEHARYDLVAERDGVFKRIQVKYVTPVDGVLDAVVSSTWSDTHGVHKKAREKGEYEALAIYNPESKIVYFVPDADFDNANSVKLRLEPPKNGQIKGVRFAEKYLTL